jgi:regulatory protein
MNVTEPESAQWLPEANPISAANNIALNQLSMSPKTRHQLEQALAKKGTPEDIAMIVIDRLAELGYVDDLAYAQMFIRSKTKTKYLAKRALGYELTKRGVSKEIVEQALADVSIDDEWESARALVAKKCRAMAGLSREVITRRLMGTLARKGYSGVIAGTVIREALENQSE